jgi:hypothetical protein
MTQFKETLKITKQHFVESFGEIFTSQFEQVCVWFMFFFAVNAPFVDCNYRTCDFRKKKTKFDDFTA